MNKKLFALIMIALIAWPLCSCGGGGNDPNDPDSTPTTETVEPTTELSLEAKVEQLLANQNTFSSRIATIESKISNLNISPSTDYSSSINSLNSQLSNLQSQFSTLQNEVSEIKSASSNNYDNRLETISNQLLQYSRTVNDLFKVASNVAVDGAYFNAEVNYGCAVKSPSTWIAQTFTATTPPAGKTGLISGINGRFKVIGNPGQIMFYLKSVDTNGNPTGGSLAIGSLNSQIITSEYQWTYISMSPNAVLVPGTKYAIVVVAPESNADNQFLWGATNVSATYSGGNYLVSTNSGTSWTASSIIDCCFSITIQ